MKVMKYRYLFTVEILKSLNTLECIRAKCLLDLELETNYDDIIYLAN